MYRVLPWMMVIAWAALIFIFSHQPAQVSKGLSVATTEFVIETMEKMSPDHGFEVSDLHRVVRKHAHFWLYLVLGIQVVHSVSLRSELRLRHVLIAFVCCVAYAISDEIHQLYVPGRGAQASDVLIDSAGVIVGIALYGLISRFSRKITH